MAKEQVEDETTRSSSWTLALPVALLVVVLIAVVILM